MEEWQVLKIPNSLVYNLEEMKQDMIELNGIFRITARQAGIIPIHVENHSEKNKQLISQIKNSNKYIKFQKRLISGYCKLVKNFKQKNYSQTTQKVIDYINMDICADLRLKTLAQMFGITPNYLSMLFHTEVGIPLTDYVNNERIRYAKRLLLTTGDSIKKVAFASGFSDSYYFCRLFKKIVV